MTDPTRSHWTSDEELLEQYVQGRISAARREGLDEHLKACDLCRARVTDERLMTAGIRSAGRRELRRDLADRIARRSVSDSGGVWRWMAAAAVLVAAVGVWRMLSPVGSPPDQAPTVSESSPAEVKESEMPAEAPATRRPAPAPVRSERPSELAITSDEPRPSAPPAAGAAVTMGETPREAMADAVRPETDEAVAAVAEPSTAATAEAWVEATVFQPVMINAQKMAKSEDDLRAKRGRAVVQEGRLEPSTTGPMAVQLQQAPRSSLPLDQRLQAASAGRAAIPAKLTLVGDSLVIQLYPTTPYGEADLLQAAILRPATDSVVVVIGRQMLGMRVPRSFISR